ncbi:neprilysin-2-like [Stegodyphus dumicola]|uniref:neprilysin-2-like n=1 Tax=Stegodyphus dumicola TaxID=202533 RepID=UPI0015B33708|nr:neprilysin-2-like [Stegodyphus dumicola]
MYSPMNIEVLLKLLCMASFENKGKSGPDICTLDETVPVRNLESLSTDLYSPSIKPGCFMKGTRNVADMLVDVKALVSSFKNYSNCEMCSTVECHQAAAAIIPSLDETVDPCNDFYQFACGGWLKRHNVSEERPYVSVYTELEDDILLHLNGILSKNLTEKERNISHIRVLKEFYDSCMDTESIHNAGKGPLKEVVNELGGWPMIEGENWDNASFDWMETLIKLRKMGFSHNMFMNLSVILHPSNRSVYIIRLDHPTLGIERDYLINKENYHYKKIIERAAYMLSSSRMPIFVFSSAVSESITELVNFETKLAEFSVPLEEYYLWNLYTVEQLKQEVPKVMWIRYFSELLKVKITRDESLFIGDINYIKKLITLINQTDKRIVANYMIWRVVLESLPLLSNEWKNLVYGSMRKTYDSKNELRWKQCVSSIMDNFRIPLNSYYVQQYFKTAIFNAANDTFQRIKSIFPDTLIGNHWRDSVSKEFARDKALALGAHIGYPKDLLNKIFGLYRDLKFANDSYFYNTLKVHKWLTDNSLKRIKNNHKGNSRWMEYAEGSSTKIVHVYHKNRIDIPAGILQYPFFHMHRPSYLNFGALGFTIAQEITNAFFSQEGKDYDKDGKHVTWWTTPKLREKFESEVSCFQDQYFTYKKQNYGLNLKVDYTMAQYIADNTGFLAAYKAYNLWLNDTDWPNQKKEKKLPGLKYTPKQLFWISAANVLCEKQTDNYLQQSFRDDTYLPLKYRVIGAISNRPEFAEDFNCPSDAPMNPKTKCQIW